MECFDFRSIVGCREFDKGAAGALNWGSIQLAADSVKDGAAGAVTLIQRVGRCLERQGLLEQDTECAWPDLDPAEDTFAAWVLYRLIAAIHDATCIADLLPSNMVSIVADTYCLLNGWRCPEPDGP